MSIEENRNIDEMKLKVSQWKRLRSNIHLGGGQKAIDKQHEQGKLTARERIALLLDKNTDTIEIAEFQTQNVGKPITVSTIAELIFYYQSYRYFFLHQFLIIKCLMIREYVLSLL